MGIEPLGDVAGDLDVLALVIAHRHLVGVVEEDVGSLERRVGEQAGGDEVVLAALVLELGHAAEFAVRHVALHDPAEFGVLTNVGLHEQGADLGVEAHGHEHLGESDQPSALLLGRRGES